MSGLLKAKKYNWKDSNMSLVSSATDRAVKKASAETEPAWKNAGKKPGLQIWRINNFKVEAWPTSQYGEFFKGDSYIILNTYKDKESDKLLYDVHFWIGQQSTQDEYGTAAYKTVELDTLLDDVPVQHREVQAHESEMFRKYFKTLVYMDGGANSGFKHVEPKAYKPRLFKVTSKGKCVGAKQVKVRRDQITSDDCFVLDAGIVFYHFTGSTANYMESYSAQQVLQQLKSSRSGSRMEMVKEEEGGEPLDNFYQALQEADAAIDDAEEDDELTQQMQAQEDQKRTTKLLKLSDAGGSISFNTVKEGDINRKDFNSNDVFILDSSNYGVFVWNGRRASENEKAKGLEYAHNYLQKTSYPLCPVTVLSEVQEKNNPDFRAAIAA
ncbi:hypothetical protein ACOMHN_027946 [Nucella lapillus]